MNKYKTCIVATCMVQYSCGNIERRMYANDGRGSKGTLEVTRLVVDTTQAQVTRVFVRSQVGLQRVVSFIRSEVARINRVGSFGETQSFISWLFLPATPGILSSSAKTFDSIPVQASPCYVLPHDAKHCKVSTASCFL